MDLGGLIRGRVFRTGIGGLTAYDFDPLGPGDA